ncbi:hypothetical protein [Caballeronia calidae]|uniref:hypothetical protein n=1 Tax=Caballeronia calidae TaxID=1777139 RepID=UPI000ACCFFD7|nr:hypothetical protein [Caballeronia calidae]
MSWKLNSHLLKCGRVGDLSFERVRDAPLPSHITVSEYGNRFRAVSSVSAVQAVFEQN